MSAKRICVACGTEYDYCPKCSKYANAPKWMWKCDTEVCNELFDAVSAYKMGLKTLEDVRNVVQNNNIIDYSKYSNGIQKTLNELGNAEPIKIEPVYKSKRKKKWNDVIEETQVVEEPSMDVELNEEITDKPIDEAISFEGISEE